MQPLKSMSNDRSVSTERVMGVLKNNSAWNVTIIKVDVSLSSLKPYHTKVTTGLCQYLSLGKGKSIIKAGCKAR